MLKPLNGKELFDLCDRLGEELTLPPVADPVELANVFLSESKRLVAPQVGPLQLPARLVLRRVVNVLILNSAKPAEYAKRLFYAAPDLSSKAYIVTWFGTFPNRDHKESRVELFEESLTKELEADLVNRLTSHPSTIAREPRVEFLVSLVQSFDPTRLTAFVDDDEALRAIVVASFPLILRTSTAGIRLGEHTEFDPEILSRLPSESLLDRLVELQTQGNLTHEEEPAFKAAIQWAEEKRSGSEQRDPTDTGRDPSR
jgi:hypothetical protein